MSALRLRAVRGFFVAGVPFAPGEILETEDCALALELLGSNKAEPADDDTAAQIQRAPAATWKPAPEAARDSRDWMNWR